MKATTAGSMAEVQAELQDYLAKKNLNSIFVDIVENILLSKPDNAISFIVTHLLDKYPYETKECKQKLVGLSNKDGEIIDDDEETCSESESDDEDEQPPKNPKEASPPSFVGGVNGRNVRRTSICAEKLCPKTMTSEVIKNIPKTEDEAIRIKQILKSNLLLKHLDEDQMLTVQNAMFLVKKNENDIIIKQGDDGDNFYIVDSGNVNVFIESTTNNERESDDGAKETHMTPSETKSDAGDKGKEDVGNKPNEEREGGEGETTYQKTEQLKTTKNGKLVTTYGDGDSFGELAIMYNAPRAATCIAAGSVRLWALDRVSFKVILMQTTTSKRNQYKGFLQEVSVLSELTEYELLTVADSLQEETFPDKSTICKEGDTGDKFYIIKEGLAICSKVDNTGTEIEVAKLKMGSYFGEIALVTTKRRQATVTASGELKCLILDRKTFKRVLGPIQDILMRNIEAYNKFQAANI